MRLNYKGWLFFIVLAVVCFLLWFKFSYPQFALVNLSVDKATAVRIAESKLISLKEDPGRFLKAAVFEDEEWADRFLQKVLGFRKEEEFVRAHSFELFYWKIRFYRQFEKEEYIIKVSPKTGEIVNFEHRIEDIEARLTLEKSIAEKKAADFLEKNFAIDLADYDFHEEKIKRYDNRLDYTFSWEKKKIYIPWKEQAGQAKLLTGATVSGDEIKEYYRAKLEVPEKFKRYIEKHLALGEYLYTFHSLIFFFLIACAVYILVKKRLNILVRFCKNWYVGLALSLVIINIVFLFNNIQLILIRYQTSVSLVSYVGTYVLRALISIFLLMFAVALVGVSAEALRKEVFSLKRYSSFLYYLKSSFFVRPVSQAVLFGYLLFFITLGLQALIFRMGQQYFGVWKEWHRLVEFSSAYIPFLSAFAIGISASLSEEITFRLFGITWAKKYLKYTLVAVIFSSLIWGFGHTQYPVFPVWFRGIEVSIIGILYGFIFIRFGIIPLVVAHYLFDVFLGVAAYILGAGSPFLFTSSLFVLLLPALWALAAFLLKKKEDEKEIGLILNQTEKYNLGILKDFIKNKLGQGMSPSEIGRELIMHNWDSELVELAVKETTD